jgi:hypothetical protein
MTPHHMTVSSMSSMSSMSSSSPNFIDKLLVDKHALYALHDIRFRFAVEGLWSTINTNHPKLKPNDISKDIVLGTIETNDLAISVTVHRTDTVSVIVACSSKPIVGRYERNHSSFKCIN